MAAITQASVEPIDSTLSSTTGTSGTSDLSSTAFMQLLVAQLQYQDPLQEMDENSFMQELATLTSMQQQEQINTNLSAMVSQSSLSQATNLIGATVTGTTTATSSDSSGTSVTGTVSSVTYSSTDGVTVQVGDSSIPFANITQVQ
jgi:flagellar basal-body rod modification protein FlgD